ncbi:MAG TPA: peptidoglycan binding domain-containing protein, partial [Chloroflexota bacterium]
MLVALLLIAGGSTVAYQSAHSDQLFPGVKVGDIDVGGMSKDAAMTRLRPVLGERENRAITVRGPDFLKKASAADLGATFDAAAAVEEAYTVGRSGSFLDRVSAQVGAGFSGRNVQAPGLHIDRSKLAAVVAQWGRDIDRPVRDTEIKITDSLAVSVSSSVVGRKLDQAAAATAIEKALSTGAEAVDLPVAETAPRVTE